MVITRPTKLFKAKVSGYKIVFKKVDLCIMQGKCEAPGFLHFVLHLFSLRISEEVVSVVISGESFLSLHVLLCRGYKVILRLSETLGLCVLVV